MRFGNTTYIHSLTHAYANMHFGRYVNKLQMLVTRGLGIEGSCFVGKSGWVGALLGPGPCVPQSR